MSRSGWNDDGWGGGAGGMVDFFFFTGDCVRMRSADRLYLCIRYTRVQRNEGDKQLP